MLMFVCALAAFGLPSAAAAEVGVDSPAMASANASDNDLAIASANASINASDIPAFCGESIAILNDNIPLFYASEMNAEAYVRFSVLDERGRTGVGEACLGPETLPTEERGEIGDIRPSGWHTVRYDDLIEDRFLYNICKE